MKQEEGAETIAVSAPFCLVFSLFVYEKHGLCVLT